MFDGTHARWGVGPKRESTSQNHGPQKSGQSGAVCYEVQEVQAQAKTLERRDTTCAGSEGLCLLQSSRLPAERFG